MKKILLAAVAISLAACGAKQQAQQPVAAAAAVTPAVAPVPSPPPAKISGKVVETMNAGGYTYMRVATTDGDMWTAVRETKVKTGDNVIVEPQMTAEKFESKSLNKTFDKLVMGVMAESSRIAAPVLTPKGGLTIADTWSKRKALKDQNVVIRGTVVKSLSGIMGKNWLHLRDGSGSRADQTDDITVTTLDSAKVGDVVTVSGTLRVDQDFGAGYTYGAIVEDAKVTQ